MHDDSLVHGTVDPGFIPVRESFTKVAATEDGLSAQLCIYHRGRQVVDLWTGPEVAGDSLMAVYSSSKGAAYLVIALLIQDGLLDPAAPVRDYWPELRAAQDGTLTVADMLGHRAGLIGVDGGFNPEEIADDAKIAARLESQEPLWEPGTAHGYHALTNAALAGELARRVTGSSLQELYETRIRAPFDIDLYLGLPEEEEQRYLPVQPPAGGPDPVLASPPPLVAVALNLKAEPPTDIYSFPNDRRVREKGQASGGGIGSARGLARMYAAAIGLENHEPLLNPETIEVVTTPQERGIDQVFGFESRFLLGFGEFPALGPRAFGHSGAAGSLALAEPDNGLAYGYCRRRFPLNDAESEEHQLALLSAMMESARIARG